MGRLLPLLALLDLALLVAALIDCLSTEGKIRALPRIVWVFIILLFPPIGPIAWFVAGRPAPAAQPADSLLSPTPKRVLAPDDDPEFLDRMSARARREEEEMLRLWEEDLRRREDDMRKKPEDPPSD
jgi:hypothetical protein